jgi:hypothetical protein
MSPASANGPTGIWRRDSLDHVRVRLIRVSQRHGAHGPLRPRRRLGGPDARRRRSDRPRRVPARRVHSLRHGARTMNADETDPMLLLLDALEQYHQHIDQVAGDGHRLFQQAESWFESRDDGPRAFEGVCRELGLDAERIRARLRQRRADVLGGPQRH